MSAILTACLLLVEGMKMAYGVPCPSVSQAIGVCGPEFGRCNAWMNPGTERWSYIWPAEYCGSDFICHDRWHGAIFIIRDDSIMQYDWRPYYHNADVVPMMDACEPRQTDYRADQIGDAMTSNEAEWGTWSQAVYCEWGSFAVGYELLSTDDYAPFGRFAKDDVTAISFRLVCDNGEALSADNDAVDTLKKLAEQDAAMWEIDSDGSDLFDITRSAVRCPADTWLHGFKTSVEPPDGSGDDTALNDVKGLCIAGADSATLQPSNGGTWGVWAESWTKCGAGTTVCGFRQRYEAMEYDGDETFLNAVQLYCCVNRPVVRAPQGSWMMVQGVGGTTGSISYTIEVGVTNHKEEQLTQEFGEEITKTVEAGMEFHGFSASASLSQAVSKSVAESSVKAWTTTMKQTATVPCEKPDDGHAAVLWQWVTSLSENDMSGGSSTFRIMSKSYWCLPDDAMRPCCPFGFCKDLLCQTCDPDPTDPTRDLNMCTGAAAAVEVNSDDIVRRLKEYLVSRAFVLSTVLPLCVAFLFAVCAINTLSVSMYHCCCKKSKDKATFYEKGKLEDSDCEASDHENNL